MLSQYFACRTVGWALPHNDQPSWRTVWQYPQTWRGIHEHGELDTHSSFTPRSTANRSDFDVLPMTVCNMIINTIQRLGRMQMLTNTWIGKWAVVYSHNGVHTCNANVRGAAERSDMGEWRCRGSSRSPTHSQSLWPCSYKSQKRAVGMEVRLVNYLSG